MRRFFKTLGLVILLILLALSVFLGATRQGRATTKSILFIPQVFNMPVRPLEWFTNEPIVQRVTFPIPDGIGQGDLYRPPGDGPYGAALLFLGVAPAGPDDARVLRLGKALARSNMVTLFYWSPSMREKRMEPDDIHNLVAAFQYLHSLPFVDPERVGMGGFCVGASYALMAASQPQINENVSFVNAFGPYFSMPELVLAIATRKKFSNGQYVDWEPDRLTREVFITHITRDLPDNEGAILRDTFQQNSPETINPNALSQEGQAAYQLLNIPSMEQAAEAISRLPDKTRENLLQVSPSTYLGDLQARVLIMHDREDDLVPAYESQRLYDVLKANNKDVTHTEYGIFRHVTPDLAGGLDAMAELWRFSRHMHSIMMQAT
ncbi:MAG: hypothetical protein FJ320_02925 [SAR202 cluster bacterium]|nr:hypothetical protein [SAR202 cluster bacterium]